MNTSKTVGIFSTLLIFIAIAVGCSDANASESVYLPAHDSCATSASFTDGEFDLDTPAAVGDDRSYSEDEMPTTDQGPPASDNPFDVDGDDDRWPFFDDSAAMMRSPYLGQGPELTLASTASSADRGHDADEAERTSGEITGVDINSADADTLTELPGIGPALAERIVDYRRARRFEDPAQLQRIKGIGPATFEDIAPYVRVE